MVLNIQLFCVETYTIQVELSIGIKLCLKYLFTYLKGTQSLSGSVYRRNFIATERTPPQTDSLVF